MKLTIDEITFDGVKGPKFFLTLHGVFSEEWKNNPTLKAIKGGNLLVILQSMKFFKSKFRMTCVLKVLIFKQMSHIKLPSLARFISI